RVPSPMPASSETPLAVLLKRNTLGSAADTRRQVRSPHQEWLTQTFFPLFPSIAARLRRRALSSQGTTHPFGILNSLFWPCSTAKSLTGIEPWLQKTLVHPIRLPPQLGRLAVGITCWD